MITFFTTPKPFIDLIKTNQINALRSWKHLSSEIEIIVFGEVQGDISVFDELGVIHIPEIDLFGQTLPLINSMFVKASELAKNPVCCYLNTDIILTRDFYSSVQQIHNQFLNNYLLVGQRYDLDVNEEINFSKQWEGIFLKKSEMKLHPPTGSDFFVFPKRQYRINDIPPLVVGRPGWDLWMIFNGVKQRNFKTIDISNSVKVYHQNHKQNYKPVQSNEPETVHNLMFLPKQEKFKYTLLQTNYFINNETVKNRSLKNMKTIIKTFLRSGKRFWKLIHYSKIKLNIGSAGINTDKSWIPTDIESLNITLAEDWARNLLLFKADNIMAEHVWEHLWEHEIKLTNANCYQFLKKGGKLRLAVPDGFFPDKEYIEYVRPGGTGSGADDHKILFNYNSLTKSLEKAGFVVKLLEWWDEQGNFHFTDWDIKDGYIMRSKRFDKRNQGGILTYTSLIVDAVKE